MIRETDYVSVRTEITVSIAGTYSSVKISPETRVHCVDDPEQRMLAAAEALSVNRSILDNELPKEIKRAIRLYEKNRRDG